jgi:hypothetical protein
VAAPKSLKQIFSKGPNFAAIEQSGQDQGRLTLNLDFFREILITKDNFQSSERLRSRFDALEDVGVRGGRILDGRVQIFEPLTELYKSRTADEKARRVLSGERLAWSSEPTGQIR